MRETLPKPLVAFGAALSIALAAPAAASIGPAAEKLDAAKASMMADSGVALELSREARALAVGDSRDAQKARLTARWLEGEALVRLNRAPEATEIIENALGEAAQTFADDKLYGDLLRSRAALKASQGEYGEALQAFLAAHERFEALGEARSQAIVLQNIGSLYSDARDYERVLRYYREAKQAFPQDVALSLSAHNNTGNALKELGRYEEAEAEFRTALTMAEDMASPMLEARILTNIASTQFLNGNYSGAERTIGTALAIRDEQASQWQPFLYGVRAQVMLARGDHAGADRALRMTFAGQALSETSPYFRDFHETGYETYTALGNHRLAARHLEAFHRIDGQARDLSAAANNALLGARFDAENQELRISKLSAEKQANEMNLAAAQQKVILLSVAIAFFIALLGVVLLALRTVNRSKAAISAANDKLTYVTQHDGLTGLFSRDHFRHLLDRAVEATGTREEQSNGVLMLIDLDRFKQVNDHYGHACGDKVLTMVAERFRKAAGEGAIIGRLGGDEFGIMLPAPISIAEARDIAGDLIAQVGAPCIIDDTEMSVGASVGLAAIEHDTATTSALMTNADLALYDAKARGRGTSVVYREHMRDKLEEQSNLETDLAQALERGELSIHYQPIVGGANGDVVCYEALMRWNHPTRGAIPPDVFIPIAENALLIQPLGAWLLREACKEAANWSDGTKLTVNVSTLQLANNTFLATVVDALAASGLAPNRLLLELTESIVLEMDEQLESLLGSLNDLGVRFALDDFGRGYSSLNYIEKMHFAMIKIDRDFVQAAAAGSRKSMAIVAAIVSLARSLDIDVTAEGIEAEDQADAMRELGCSCFQGLLFGAPEPRETVAGSSANVAQLPGKLSNVA